MARQPPDLRLGLPKALLRRVDLLDERPVGVLAVHFPLHHPPLRADRYRSPTGT